MVDLKGIEVADILGISEPLSKLIESVSRGVGKIYEPTHVRRMAKAKSEEIKLISDKVNDNINLPTTYIDGNISIDASNAEELLKRTGNRLLFQEMKKQQNIDSVVGHAYTELENETVVSNEPVDLDWIIRFMNSVEDISNEEMQILWGKILAGEIKQPNTYTLRTLEKIRNISVEEAHKFTELSKYILNTRDYMFILSKKDFRNEFGIRFEDILILEECGLVSSQILSITMKTNNELPIIVLNSQIIGIITGLASEFKDVMLSIYSLTNCGKQLYNTINCKGDDKYAVRALELIKQEVLSSSEFDISAHWIKNISSDMEIEYDDKNLLSNSADSD